MSNKATSIYFAIFAVAYVVYVLQIVKHDIHFTNAVILTTFVGLAAYYYIKSRREMTD
tara:strand:- start:14720 stop:14893 length:174 start_codon:yes stop_codon:yes gene_type:complete